MEGGSYIPPSQLRRKRNPTREADAITLARACQANAIGRSSKTVREFLEKNWKADMDRSEVIQLAVKSLLEVVQTGAKNIDLAVMDGFGKVRVRPRRRSSFPSLSPPDGKRRKLITNRITKSRRISRTRN